MSSQSRSTPHAPLKANRRLALSLLVGLAFVAGNWPATAAAQTIVFAAASLKDVLDAQIGVYRKSGGGDVRVSYAASSALARQIEAGAPADLFISADVDWMTWLDERHLVQSSTHRDLVTNRLALIAPRASTLRLTIGPNMPLARALGNGRLAMAAPEVPAGRYGRAALKTLGVWNSVENDVASTDNVRGALAYVSRGETPLGVVYDTDAQSDPGVRIVALFPVDSHPAIIYPAALLQRSNDPNARRFLVYLSSPAARPVYVKFGFKPLSGR